MTAGPILTVPEFTPREALVNTLLSWIGHLWPSEGLAWMIVFYPEEDKPIFFTEDGGFRHVFIAPVPKVVVCCSVEWLTREKAECGDRAEEPWLTAEMALRAEPPYWGAPCPMIALVPDVRPDIERQKELLLDAMRRVRKPQMAVGGR